MGVFRRRLLGIVRCDHRRSVGIVTLADLYLGFVLTAVVIAGFERGFRAVLWILPLPFLGNVWAVVWFVVRLPELFRRLARSH
jgi:hypothetical protein